MELFFDLYGFLSVVLKAGTLMARSVLLGSALFLLLLAAPLAARMPPHRAAALADIGRFWLLVGGGATLLFTAAAAALGVVALMGTLDASLPEALGAGFVLSALGVAVGAVGLMALAFDRRPAAWPPAPSAPAPSAPAPWSPAPWSPAPASPAAWAPAPWVMAGLVLLVLLSAVAGSHAMSRPEGRAGLLAATALHQAGAALWLGGLPALLMALRQDWPAEALRQVGGRYSALAGSGVLLIVLGAAGFWLGYIETPEALYGTAYGAMAATKGQVMAVLLLLGAANWVLLHRFARRGSPDVWVPRLRRLIECELIAAFAVFGLAASLTSVPPSLDLPEDRASWAEVVERFTPQAPRLASPSHADLAIPALQGRLDAQWAEREGAARPQAFIPGEGFLPPRNAFDMAWSEYNHHIAGFIVLLVGLAALLDRTGAFPWARHWPLLFLLLAGFLLVRSDPEVWPMGDIPLLASLRDPEVLQHKLLSLLVIGFALSEWKVRLDGGRGGAAYVFPLSMVLGGFLLLTHTHAIGNVKEALLVELSHLPLGVLAVVAGCARWLELRGVPQPAFAGLPLRLAGGSPASEARWAGYVWPLCLIGISLLLIFYRES